MNLEVFDDHACELGEGPVWDAANDEVIWLDILRAQVHRRRLDGVGARRTETLADAIGCIALRTDGSWLLADARGPALRHRDEPPAPITTFEALEGGALPAPLRANDGGVDPVGRFWFGTIAWDLRPDVAALYRMDDPDRPVVRVLDGVSISNGLGWSPQGTTMYYIDSPTQRIDRFDYDVDTGSASNRRPLAEVPAGMGVPDGLAVDAEGGVWVALFDGSAVVRYEPDGTLDHLLVVPTPRVTSCAFVGAELDRLVITTAAVELDPPTPPAGATFLADVGVRGLAVPLVPA